MARTVSPTTSLGPAALPARGDQNCLTHLDSNKLLSRSKEKLTRGSKEEVRGGWSLLLVSTGKQVVAIQPCPLSCGR